MKFGKLSSMLAGTLVLFGAVSAESGPMINAVATQTTVLEDMVQVAMGLGYNPAFDQYYGAEGGSPSMPGQVWDSSGNRLQNHAPINLDYRGVWYNPNTGNVEVQTFAASATASTRGLFSATLDASGLYTGTYTKLTSIAGISNSQSVADYDASRDRIYSRSINNIVNVAAHATGNLLGTITLDLASVSGGISLQNYTIGYAEDADALVTFDLVGSRALVFAMDGSYLGESLLTGLVNPANSWSLAYENGQLFIGDNGNNTWVGYDIFTASVPEPETLALFGVGLAGIYFGRRRLPA